MKDQKYEALKAHAEEKLEEANKEIENIARSQVPEVLNGLLGGLKAWTLKWMPRDK